MYELEKFKQNFSTWTNRYTVFTRKPNDISYYIGHKHEGSLKLPDHVGFIFSCCLCLLFVMAVEGRKRTFPLTGPYVPAPYTSSDSEKPNETPRNSSASGTHRSSVFFRILNVSLSGAVV